jgi:hypothetical protein
MKYITTANLTDVTTERDEVSFNLAGETYRGIVQEARRDRFVVATPHLSVTIPGAQIVANHTIGARLDA